MQECNSNEKENTNVKESKEKYVEGLGGRKGKERKGRNVELS